MAVDFKVDFEFVGNQVTNGFFFGQDFPSYEIYYDSPDGRIHTLFQHLESGFAFTNLDGDPVQWGGPWLKP